MQFRCLTAYPSQKNLESIHFWYNFDRRVFNTNEIADTFRPTSRTEIMNGQISIYSYLDALEGAYEHYEQIAGKVDYDADFKKHIYHAPFPGMTFQAHRDIVSRLTAQDKATIQLNFQQKVAESLYFAKRIGSCYGGSNFVCLLGLLNSAENLNPGDRISLFAYGSGCQGGVLQWYYWYSGVDDGAIAQPRPTS